MSHSDGKFQVTNLLPHSNLNPSSRRRLRMRESATHKRRHRGNKKVILLAHTHIFFSSGEKSQGRDEERGWKKTFNPVIRVIADNKSFHFKSDFISGENN